MNSNTDGGKDGTVSADAHIGKGQSSDVTRMARAELREDGLPKG